MLSFAVEYHEVVDAMTMRPGNVLRAYELSPQAWTLLWKLCRVLKVRTCSVGCSGPQDAHSGLVKAHEVIALQGNKVWYSPSQSS